MATRGGHQRQDWFSCACCPPNVLRFLGSLGGSIYADRPSDRLLIVNGQLLKEGDMVDGRLVLEGIGRQGATWRLGEQRFSTRF